MLKKKLTTSAGAAVPPSWVRFEVEFLLDGAAVRLDPHRMVSVSQVVAGALSPSVGSAWLPLGAPI